MTDPMPDRLAQILAGRTPPDHGELVDHDDRAVLRWSADGVHGRPTDSDGDALVELDRAGVLAVQLSMGRGEHRPDGVVETLKALWTGRWREALFVEFRGRSRVRVHAAIDDHPRLREAAADLPELRLESSVEVTADALLDALAFARTWGAKFVVGARRDASESGRPRVRDDDPSVAGLPALAWIPVAAESRWADAVLDTLELGESVAVAIAREGGAFAVSDGSRLQAGDLLLVGGLAGGLADLRTATAAGPAFELERAAIGDSNEDGGTSELLLAANAFGELERDPDRRPPAWRFATLRDRAGLMASAVDTSAWDADTALEDHPWPDGVVPVAVHREGAWHPATAEGARGEGLLVIAGDRLAVAGTEADL